MKKVLLFSLSLITLISCETTPIEGCTDPNAINYNNQADINNNSCDFTADILFYMNEDAGIFFYNNNVQELTFYINGNNIGSQYNDGGFYTAQTPPNCFDNFFTTGSVYWSDNSYTTISWEAIDETDYVWYGTTTNLEANECLTMELTAKKLKVYQENN
mgnify:CR=1 FL=1